MTELATLTVAEAEVLADCEQTISHGLQTFVEVGTALSLIRDNRLYRATHATFDAYLAERWQISRPRAYELMTAAGVVSAMADTDRPTNERQARELARVPEAERAEVWRAANEVTDGKPTAAAIRAAATPQTAAERDISADAAGEVEPSTPTVDPAAASPAPEKEGAGAGEVTPASRDEFADALRLLADLVHSLPDTSQDRAGAALASFAREIRVALDDDNTEADR